MFAGLTPNPTYYFRIGVVILAGDQSGEPLAVPPAALPAGVSLWAPHLARRGAIRRVGPAGFLAVNRAVIAPVANQDVGGCQDGRQV